MPSTGDLLADRYRILAPLGAGGMATVYRAHDERLDREVALKVLTPNLAADPAVAARFEREARTLAAAAHSGVVGVFDVDPGDPASGREPFFVMELCPGGSLADRLEGGQRAQPEELVRIVASVADSLAGLHARGLVHRDVKPSNILLTADRAKLADFGLARSDTAPASDLTIPGTVAGTMAYLAPEVLAGHAAGPPADVYALAVAAFAGLTGSLPRPSTSLAELVAAAREPAALVSEVAPDLGTSFDDALATALDADPLRRPDAVHLASSLTAALGRWLRAGGSPPGSEPPEASPADELDATTAMEIPLASDPTARFERAQLPEPSPPCRRRGPRLVAGVIAVAIVAVAVLFVAAISPRTGPPPRSALPGASPSGVLATPTIEASPSISPDPADRIQTALDELSAAIAAASGGGGLKGKDRNELDRLVADVRAAVERGNLDEAMNKAKALRERVDKLADELNEDRAKRLQDAVAALQAALEAG